MAITITQGYLTGPQTALFESITTSLTHSGDPMQMVNGDTSSGSQFQINASQTVAGSTVLFKFFKARLITEFTLTKDATGGGEVYKLQGSNDSGGTWDDLQTFTVTGSGSQAVSVSTTIPYKWLRFLGVSGTTTNPLWYECDFKMSYNNYEAGGRNSIITCTTSLTLGSGSGGIGTFINGNFGTSSVNSWWPNSGQTVSGQTITFQFSDPVIIVAAGPYTDPNGATTEGTWKWQGSNNNSTWTDLSTAQTFDAPGYATGPGNSRFVMDVATGSYLYYRMLGVSGTSSNAPFIEEINFTILDGSEAIPGPTNTKSLFLSSNSRTGPAFWNQTTGVKSLMLGAGVFYNQNASSGASGWASVEAADTFAAVGLTGLAGPWASSEVKDAFVANGGVPDTAVWNDTEPHDTFTAYVAVPPAGTWASTEAPDTIDTAYYAHQPRFEVENAIQINAGGELVSTNGPNRILCMVYGATANGAPADQVLSVTTSGLVWHRQDYLNAAYTEDGKPLHLEMWWAYAKDKLTSQNTVVTTGGGQSFTKQLFALVTIKGLGGNFNNPFSDTNPFSYGSNIGAFVTPPSVAIQAAAPVATGPVSSSGATQSSVVLDAAVSQGVTIDGTNLKATSTGSGSGHSYALIDPAYAKSSGRVYFEAKFKHIVGSEYGVGVSTFDDSGSGIVATITNGGAGIFLNGGGAIYAGAAVAGRLPTLADNDVIGISIDADNGYGWVRNITQNTAWNDNSNSNPALSSSNYASGGFALPVRLGGVPTGTPISTEGARTPVNSNPLLPILSTSSTALAEIDANFGNATFVGTAPAGYQAGWFRTVPAVTPTRVAQHAIVLGFDMTAPEYTGPAQAPPGFTLNFAHLNDISAGMQLSIYSKVISQNILTTDNELMIEPVPVKHWAMMYDTIVSDIVSPGNIEVVEATDSFHAVGYGPGGAGQFGFFTPTEARDTAAFVGTAAVVVLFNSIEAPDTMSVYGRVNPVRGTFNTTGATDRFVAAGLGRGEDGTWTSAEALDTLTMNGIVPISGPFDVTETPDRFRAIGAGVTVSRRRRRRNFVT